MNGILDAAVVVDHHLRQAGLRYCLIGGIALQRWGQPRTTLDVDVTVMTEFGNEEPVIGRLLESFEARIPDAAEFAKQSRVVLLKTSAGVGVDVSLGALPFESRMIDRSTVWQLDNRRSLTTCSANDLIVQKAFAGRGQDWVDIQNIIVRQADSLDKNLILQELQPLLELKGDTTAYERLKQLFLSEIRSTKSEIRNKSE